MTPSIKTSPLVTPRASPKRMPVRLPVYDDGPGDEDHPDAEHPDNKRPMPVSSANVVWWWTRLIPMTITIAASNAPSITLKFKQDRKGDAGNHAVDERVAEEGHAPYHHPGSDHGECNGCQGTSEQRSLLEGELEGGGQPVHVRAPLQLAVVSSGLIIIINKVSRCRFPAWIATWSSGSTAMTSATPAAVATVVHALAAAAGPRSAAELNTDIGATVPLSSLYRTLAVLEETNIIAPHFGAREAHPLRTRRVDHGPPPSLRMHRVRSG